MRVDIPSIFKSVLWQTCTARLTICLLQIRQIKHLGPVDYCWERNGQNAWNTQTDITSPKIKFCYCSWKFIRILVYFELQLEVSDVLGEPEGARSVECIWDFSKTLFKCCLECCYGLMTLLCGPCLAGYWGVSFGILVFQHVWYCTPRLWVCQVTCGLFQRCFKACFDCCLTPCTRACGGCFWHFHRDSPKTEEPEIKVERLVPKKTLAPPPASRENSYHCGK